MGDGQSAGTYGVLADENRRREPGIDGGFMRRQHPQQPMANTIAVDSVDAALEALAANGGRIALPKMAIPGVGWLAYFHDPRATSSA
jgi:predicted enzyme related to lactoylglutathione lyase